MEVKEHIYCRNRILEYTDGKFLATKSVKGEILSQECPSLDAAKAFIRKKPKGKGREFNKFTQLVQLTLKVRFDPKTHTFRTAAMNVMSKETFDRLLGPLADGEIEITEVKYK